jgi:hypothetical protein
MFRFKLSISTSYAIICGGGSSRGYARGEKEKERMNERKRTRQ